jgi:hypothetical protein
VEPSAGEGAIRGVRVAPVPLEHLGTTEHDLPAFARSDGMALLVPDLEIEIDAGSSDASELRDQVVPIEKGVTGHGFGEAVRIGEPG